MVMSITLEQRGILARTNGRKSLQTPLTLPRVVLLRPVLIGQMHGTYLAEPKLGVGGPMPREDYLSLKGVHGSTLTMTVLKYAMTVQNLHPLALIAMIHGQSVAVLKLGVGGPTRRKERKGLRGVKGRILVQIVLKLVTIVLHLILYEYFLSPSIQ